ncbi:MAG TPA: chromosome partitioning protein ParA, partial [Dongiaceae bacterium]|nr:chromosome partitioning protein ParA [Dongiaceae bacterium]
ESSTAAAAAVTAAQAEVDGGDAEQAHLTERIAAGEAQEAAVRRRLQELQGRLARLRQRAEEVAAERARLAAELADDATLAAARQQVATHQATLDRIQAEAGATEQARVGALEAEAGQRAIWQAAQAEQARLAAEERALAQLLSSGQSDLWPPLLNMVSVTPGYEGALGAALGDDLTASSDAGAPIHWRALPEYEAPPALPDAAVPLSQYVRGSPALARRLSQIGLVASEEEGRVLAGQLVQGQRLVTRDGATWRWDGFTISAGTPTAAETRLRQRTRLNELRAELATANAALAEAEGRHATARQAAEAATAAERQWRDGLQAAFRAVDAARKTLEAATERAAATASRLTALQESASGLATDIAESDAQIAAANQDLAGLPDLAAVREQAGAVRSRLADLRARLVEARSAHDRLQREADQRNRRLATIVDERKSWAERAAGAARQLSALAERRGEVEGELARLAERPAEMAEQRHKLLELIETAGAKRREAADRLAEGETRLNEAVRELKAAETRLAEARENRIRAEAAVAQAREHADDLSQRIRERLDCAPEETGGLAELKEDEPLPDREAIEARLQRLQRERDNMGPVNLRAEAEAAEMEQQIAGLQSERSDLVNAVARLRTGIASLNREGRERLLAAFELVNGHFQSLFTRLFGGGHAHLKLTEAEDPLEAGLEIMASPPGKRLQVMSLLSGGEQALTALALLFAVFLTNPAPICVLDEVDAPLDDANVDRFCTLVEELAHSTATRFLVITHHRMTMARMDRLFGVTMAERGVSQLVSVDLQQAARMRAAE